MIRKISLIRTALATGILLAVDDGDLRFRHGGHG
jgi:hypothetical protein